MSAGRPHLLCLAQVLNVVPMLLRIPGLINKLFSGQKQLMAELEELVTEHRMTRDPAQPPRDLTDAYLAEVEKVGHSQDRGWGVP